MLAGAVVVTRSSRLPLSVMVVVAAGGMTAPAGIESGCSGPVESIVGADFYVDTQEPIVTADSSPEPDVAVIRGDTRDYADRNPPASAVALVVEVERNAR